MKARTLIFSLFTLMFFIFGANQSFANIYPPTIKHDARGGNTGETPTDWRESLNFIVNGDITKPYDAFVIDVVTANVSCTVIEGITTVRGTTTTTNYVVRINAPYVGTLQFDGVIYEHGSEITREPFSFNITSRSRSGALEMKDQDVLNISPNPSKGDVVINFENVYDQTIPVYGSVYDQFGREVYQIVEGALLGAGKHRFPVNLTALPSNLYKVVFIADGKHISSKTLFISK